MDPSYENQVMCDQEAQKDAMVGAEEVKGEEEERKQLGLNYMQIQVVLIFLGALLPRGLRRRCMVDVSWCRCYTRA